MNKVWKWISKYRMKKERSVKEEEKGLVESRERRGT